MGQFRQLVKEFFQPDSVELKLGVLSVKYSDAMQDDLAKVLADLRAKRVFFAPLESELWNHVFSSLALVTSALTSIDGTLQRKGPDDIKECLSCLINAVGAYRVDYETDYLRFMSGPSLPDLAPAHKERNWPALGDAAEDLIRLRRIFGQAMKNLASFAHDDEILVWPNDELSMANHWMQYAKRRKLCNTCGWDLNYLRFRCPYNFPVCPSFDPKDTVFEYEDGDADAVQVTGSFSSWKPISLEQFDYAKWGTRLHIDPGIHYYKFIVDGIWHVDPSNPHTKRDEAGNVNSVLFVEGRREG